MSRRNSKIFLNCSFLGSSWVFYLAIIKKYMIHFLLLNDFTRKIIELHFQKCLKRSSNNVQHFWVDNMKIYVTGCLIFLVIFRNKKNPLSKKPSLIIYAMSTYKLHMEEIMKNWVTLHVEFYSVKNHSTWKTSFIQLKLKNQCFWWKSLNICVCGECSNPW